MHRDILVSDKNRLLDTCKYCFDSSQVVQIALLSKSSVRKQGVEHNKKMEILVAQSCGWLTFE